jgi:hypothetical protein
VVCDDDQSALAAPALAAADQAPTAEVLRVPGGHYAPFLNAHETAVEAELPSSTATSSPTHPTPAESPVNRTPRPTV